MLFALYHIELRSNVEQLLTYIFVWVGEWVLCVCAMYWDVSKSQYVIVADVKQVREAIDNKLTNEHELNNIECCIRNRDDLTTIQHASDLVRFYSEQQPFIPIKTTPNEIPFLPPVNRECKMLCCTKCEYKHVPSEWFGSNANQITFFISWNSVNFFIFSLSCSFIRLFIFCVREREFLFFTKHRLRYIHIFVNKFIFVSQIKSEMAY